MNAFVFTTLAASLLLGSVVAAEPIDNDKNAYESDRDRAEAVVAAAREAAHPRGRIGIALGRTHEALALHLGLDPDEVILVERVIEGQAAERAGVETYDIITHIDGESPATPQRLRHVVEDKEPGDAVQLIVIRAGKPMELSVPVEQVDSRTARGPFRTPLATRLPGDVDDLVLQLNDSLLRLQDRGLDKELTSRLLREQVMQWLEQRPRHAIDEEVIRELQERFRQDGRAIEISIEGGDIARMYMRPRPEPTRGGIGRSAAPFHPQRLERIEQRLERIEAMLEQMLERSRD